MKKGKWNNGDEQVNADSRSGVKEGNEQVNVVAEKEKDKNEGGDAGKEEEENGEGDERVGTDTENIKEAMNAEKSIEGNSK